MRRPDRTQALAGLAGALTVGVASAELARVWRRGRAPLPRETAHVVGAGAEAARETVQVVVAGYRSGSNHENTLLNLFVSYALTAATARVATHSIRRHGRFGPFRDARVGGRHIHHFIPGIALAFISGAVSIASRDERLDPWLAMPFGVGTALTLDEVALLVELEDVYWSEEGVLSLQVSLGTVALLGTLTLVLRTLRRGEAEVLEPPSNGHVVRIGSAT
jgi:hypothetical protein